MTVWRRRLESRSKECMQTHIRRQIFYHKTDDCKFIRRVPKEELLIFDSEEAANSKRKIYKPNAENVFKRRMKYGRAGNS